MEQARADRRLGSVADGEFRLGYRPALEGLRGVAIALVVVFHAVTFLAPKSVQHHAYGMFIGVDIFFTLSGFLITTLLLQENRATGGISFRNFYIRRGLRLLPAVVVMLIVMAGYVVVVDLPLRTYAKTGFGVITYTTNWLLLNDVKFTEGFGHMWSLAIEEQFYLLWPALLFLLVRAVRRRPQMLLAIVLAVVAGGAIWRVVLWERYELWTKVYFRTDARLDQLLLGAALAIALHLGILRSRPRPWLAAVSMTAILAIALTTDHAYPPYFRITAFVTACAAAAAIFSTLEPGGIVHAALSSGPMRFLGKISYSLYLWHLPVDHAFLAHFDDLPTMTKIVLTQVIGFALAVASHYFVERPFLDLKERLMHSRSATADPDGAPVLAATD